MLQLHRVLNKICSVLDIRQGLEYALISEYTGAVTIPGSEYASNSKYASVIIQGSVENGLSYSSGSQNGRARIHKDCEFVKVSQGSVETLF